MGFLTPKSAWGKSVESAHERGQTVQAQEKKKKQQAKLRKLRAEKKQREEEKKLKRAALKAKATKGWFS